MTEYNGVERSKTEPAERLCELLDERGIEWNRSNGEHGMVIWERDGLIYSAANAWPRNDGTCTKLVLHVGYPTPEQAIAATVGNGRAKSHPWGYEADTGFFDTTHCECGELNDISAKFCNQCGREIELDMSVIEYAEDWYVSQHTCKVNADGTLTSLRDGKTYVDAATVDAGTCHIEETEHEREIPYDLPDSDGGWYTEVTYDCDECGYENRDPNIRFCGGCGRRVVSE